MCILYLKIYKSISSPIITDVLVISADLRNFSGKVAQAGLKCFSFNKTCKNRARLVFMNSDAITDAIVPLHHRVR
jgi:hypothetical protein